MRLSVVIPAHNAEATVAHAVRSALAQTEPPDEIVVVDDGSTDGTAAALSPFADTVRLVHRRQGGPSAARNTGVEEATGDWIALLDADDEWHPMKLARQMPVALSAPGIVAVATDWAREVPAVAPPDPVPVSAVTSTQLLLLNRFQTSTVVMRRAAAAAAGGFDPTLDGVEDWDMWLRLADRGEIRKLDWPFVGYTDTAEGYSKGLERVYRTGRVMLERRLASLGRHRARRILAWHHLRFAVAFALDGNRGAARRCLAEGRAAGLSAAAPAAAVRHLAPFLVQRLGRRLSTPRAAHVDTGQTGTA